jgi:hypothetical protein
MKTILTLALGIGIGAGGLFGAQTLFSAKDSQPYAGQDGRQISSLSADDIKQLENGEGWGLAKPAEFNGYPGPAHVLELADGLDLTPQQRAAIDDSFARMNEKARKRGAALIEAEAALDAAFQDRSVTSDILKRRLAAAEEARAMLRGVHLSAHLEITPLLSDKQKEEYAALRGYGDGQSGHVGH